MGGVGGSVGGKILVWMGCRCFRICFGDFWEVGILCFGGIEDADLRDIQI